MKKLSMLSAAAAVAALSIALLSCDGQNARNAKNARGEDDLTRWVDQYIGTGGHGHVFMGASVPFGAVQLGPVSIPRDWDWTSGYHRSDTTVIGFAHTHLSGTGIGDLCDIILMPTTGATNHARGDENEGYESGMWSHFSRRDEYCAPGYYATYLERYEVGVELTATERVGFHKYTFPTNAPDSRVVIDLAGGTGWDAPTETFMRVAGESTIEGYRFSKGWAPDQKIFFVAEFSRPFQAFKIYDGNTPVEGDEYSSRQTFGEAMFGEAGGEAVYVKVAISPVGVENARENMAAELPGWDFGGTIAEAKDAWNDELSKIRIETDDEATKRIFYTALYHTMIAPSLFCDVEGDYRGADGLPKKAASFTNYTTLSLWDTYRAAHPLMTIIHPEKVPDIINTMINIYRQQGKLPVWHLAGNETDTMVGNPAIPVVADAILKGFTGFDREAAYEAMKTSAMLDERGLDHYKKYGYIPFDLYGESVATTLEYALADWALGQVAMMEGRNEDYDYFDARSRAYRHFFDPGTGFLRGRAADGGWRTPFDPFASTHRADDYTEGNAWQYTWLVPHDVEGLAAAFGGMEPFHAKLDSLFVARGDMGAQASPDISGLIGQYAHGNEPSHHITYFYTMTGQPHKTARLVRRVLSELYNDAPDGLSGNEDVGQMSAWYVLSALGFYQVEPAGGRYFFGSPAVDAAELEVGEGKIFTIEAMDNSADNIYIQRVVLNGREHDKPYITHADISAGGEMILEMGPEPAIWY
ncbi:MAG: GH92 family glycosyl hydrolase [Alistipes sp.]|jgi:predicted alpha-1,2-mannosidase|nr:GH92 family glycosyl hydrolase [Alistipes sp.]